MGPPAKGKLVVDRVQTGVRVEKRILKCFTVLETV